MLDSSKLKEYADSSFKFDENGRDFSKRIIHTHTHTHPHPHPPTHPHTHPHTQKKKKKKTTVRKKEIAHYEQFLLFPQCFTTDLNCIQRLVWKRVQGKHVLINDSKGGLL